MAQVDPMPPRDEMERRREQQWIIDPIEVAESEDKRVRSWASEVMSKNEHKLDRKKFKNHEIVTGGVVEPEAIDMRLIYPFHDLNWIIFRNGMLWSLMLRSKEKMLCTITYAQIA